MSLVGQTPLVQPVFESGTASKLDQIFNHLGLAGFKSNFHTLYELKVYRRDIIRVNDHGLHLIWRQTPAVEMIMPLPKEYIKDHGDLRWLWNDMSEESRGLFYSYTRIIKSRLDLQLALDERLLSQPFTDDEHGWQKWKRLEIAVRGQRKDDDIVQDCHRRYEYGDLRLDRLNLLMWVFHGSHYYHTRDPIVSLFEGYGKWVIIVFAWITVALTAMQVTLTTAGPEWIQITYVWFSYIVMILVLVQVMLALLFTIGWVTFQVYGWFKRES